MAGPSGSAAMLSRRPRAWCRSPTRSDCRSRPAASRSHRSMFIRSNGRFSDRDVASSKRWLVRWPASCKCCSRGERCGRELALAAHRPDAEVLLGESAALERLASRSPRRRAAEIHVPDLGRKRRRQGTRRRRAAPAKPAARGPLIVVNCGTDAPTMMEAELFGYRKGAFAAPNETIPDCSNRPTTARCSSTRSPNSRPIARPSCWRVIDGKPFRPLGSTTDIKPDVRIIVSTNRDLEQEVRRGAVSLGSVLPAQVAHVGRPAVWRAPRGYRRRSRPTICIGSPSSAGAVTLRPAAKTKLRVLPLARQHPEFALCSNTPSSIPKATELDAAAIVLPDEPIAANDLAGRSRTTRTQLGDPGSTQAHGRQQDARREVARHHPRNAGEEDGKVRAGGEGQRII